MAESAIKYEIIEFIRPDKNECNLFITNLPCELSDEDVYDILYGQFSEYGLLYEIQVKRDAAGRANGDDNVYAFVKYFSTLVAARAKRELTGRLFLRGQHVRMQYARRGVMASPQPLYITRCYDLISHYVGFNGWSLEIQKVEEDKASEQEEFVAVNDQSPVSVTYSVWVRLYINQGNLKSEGVGSNSQTWCRSDPSSRSIALCKAKKLAYSVAVQAAFQRVVIVLTDTGIVHVEINTTLEDQLNADCALKPEVTVNEVQDDEMEDSSDDDELAVLAHLAEAAGNIE